MYESNFKRGIEPATNNSDSDFDEIDAAMALLTLRNNGKPINYEICDCRGPLEINSNMSLATDDTKLRCKVKESKLKISKSDLEDPANRIFGAMEGADDLRKLWYKIQSK